MAKIIGLWVPYVLNITEANNCLKTEKLDLEDH